MMVWIILGWLACAVLAYIRTRGHCRRDGLGWSRFDRLSVMLYTGILGPIGLIVALLWRSGYLDKPAKW